MDDPNTQDDALWQAEVLLAHRQCAHYRMIIIIGLIVVLFIGLLVNQMRFSGVVTGLLITGLSLVGVLLLLGLSIIWRCPACDASLGRSDPQFCPGCGVQLR